MINFKIFYIGDFLQMQVNKTVEENSFEDAEDLTIIKGIGPSVAEKLNKAGIQNISQLITKNPNFLSSIRGISAESAKKIINEGKQILENTLFKIDDPPSNNNIQNSPSLPVNVKNNKKIEDISNQDPFDTDFEIEEVKNNIVQDPIDIIKEEEEVEVKEIYNKYEEVEEEEEEGEKNIDQDLFANAEKIDFSKIIQDPIDITREVKEVKEKIEEDIDQVPSNNDDLESIIGNFLEISNKEAEMSDFSERTTILQSERIDPVRNNTLEEYDTLSNEQHQVSYIKKIVSKAEVLLKGADYFFINKKSIVPEIIQSHVDFVSVKIININNNLKCLIITPVKISNFKGTMILSKDKTDYAPANDKINFSDTEKKIISNDGIERLIKAQELIFQDLISEGELFDFFQNFLKIKISIEKTLSHKNLFFRTGNLQYKIIINPILLCLKTPAFLVKSIPFPYQKKSNVHFIEFERLINLLEFQEKKYSIIETYSKDKNSLEQYFGSYNKFVKDIRIFSSPFLIVGFVLLFIILFQIDLFDIGIWLLIISISIGGIFFYSLLFSFLFYKFHLKNSFIKKDFLIPYYQKNIEIDEQDLSLINEDLTPELLEQFTYECFKDDAYIDDKLKIEEKKTKLKNKKFNSNHIPISYTSFLEEDEEN